MGELLESSKTETDEYIATNEVRKAVDCSFDENPIFITWEKKDFQLKITMDYQRDVSLITFKSKE
jgi:hypothetical protein